MALRAVGGPARGPGGVGDAGAAPLPAPLRKLAGPATADNEVMEILYAGGKRLLVPLARLDLIQKYSGIEGIAPRLDQLGGSSWNKTKSKVRTGMRDMAEELLKLYAERQLARAPILAGSTRPRAPVRGGLSVRGDAGSGRARSPIVLEDLGQSKPMDRLLCGDVGFGKTEVAMRAAFRAVDAGYQVAVLAPTTILADQHLEVFTRRFEGFPVTIERLSRLRVGKDLKDLKTRIAAGKVDITLGTHRLLSKDIEFHRLGLVIVDEEQRFGVAQKERLKQLKKNVHVLAMSATPLPRTLQLSLAGVRDMVVIETPPKDRMAIETAVLPFSEELVREAIEYELERGGQVFYVYNRVESIEQMAGVLRELVPGLRITIGHGQLDERELYRRMHAFTAREYDVLLATTIIENGIDIPTVNTMLIHRADRFGLAQLYQLRGRVGRSRELAYCYLLVPPDAPLTEEARRRLEALREFTELGAGFRIAGRDLEIRGAGNLLGGEQSGHIAELGIETYLKMLEETVRELKGESVEEGPSVALDLPLTMTIPKDYITDENLRMEIYRKLATAELPRQELLEELSDRFGRPPKAVLALLDLVDLKRAAEALRVQAISATGGQLVFRLRRDARIDVDRLIRYVSTRAGAAFSPTGVLTPRAARRPVGDRCRARGPRGARRVRTRPRPPGGDRDRRAGAGAPAAGRRCRCPPRTWSPTVGDRELRRRPSTPTSSAISASPAAVWRARSCRALFDQFVREEMLAMLARERGLIEGSLPAAEAIEPLLAENPVTEPTPEQIAAYFTAHGASSRFRRASTCARSWWTTAWWRSVRARADRRHPLRRRAHEGEHPGIRARGRGPGNPGARRAAAGIRGPHLPAGGGRGSQVVPADYGFHVFEVVERWPEESPTAEEVAPEIRRRLRESTADARVEALFADASRYTVTVYDRNLPFNYRGAFPISRPHEER